MNTPNRLKILSKNSLLMQSKVAFDHTLLIQLEKIPSQSITSYDDICTLIKTYQQEITNTIVVYADPIVKESLLKIDDDLPMFPINNLQFRQKVVICEQHVIDGVTLTIPLEHILTQYENTQPIVKCIL